MDYSILVNKDNPLSRAYIPNTLENAHSEYKENIFICDFVNKDYFWLESIEKSEKELSKT